MRHFSHWLAMIVLLALSQFAGASIPNETVSKWQSDAQRKFMAPFKSVFVSFWDKEFRNYHLHDVVRKMIDQIDNQEMLVFLTEKGVTPTRADLVTPKNLIAYFRHKDLGTEATYAWIDLYKGTPDFLVAVQDWQAIRKEHGFEFTPAYYLLFNAKLKTKMDVEIWSDLFKTTFGALSKSEEDKKVLLLLCLMTRVWRELDLVEPPASERFAFLEDELKDQTNTSRPFAQALAFDLYAVNFSSRQYTQAAKFGRILMPKTTSLLFTFLAQTLAKDLHAARLTLSEMETLLPRDENMISTYREVVKELEEMKRESN